MAEREPVRADYCGPERDRTRVPADGSAGARFLAGLVIGSAVSLVYWPSSWNALDQHGAVALLWILPLAKILVAVICLCFAGKRAFGAGLIVSIAIGALIFFGTCAANFKI